MQQQQTVLLAGAGLAGSLLAVMLARRGYAVKVFERRSDMRKVRISAGRSINLALSVRGLHALEMAGLREEIEKILIPMPGRMVHPVAGDCQFQPYSHDPSHYINSVSRGELNMHLMDLAEQFEGVELFFNHRCIDANLAQRSLQVFDENTGETRSVHGDVVIACDGAFSAVRLEMMKTSRFNYSQEYLAHGYKELSIPPGPGGSHLMEPNALHIWPREQFMLIALPNTDGSFTCTLFFPFEGPVSFASLDSPDKVQAFFAQTFPDVLPLMPTLHEDWQANPASALVTVRCWPWVQGRVALLGDAAHAIVPFYGQGMNAAFEDCTELINQLDLHKGDWDAALEVYQQIRKPNADAIAWMAVDNYTEMRDRVADADFQFQKKIEHFLERNHPLYRSRYELVSFSRAPYAEAMQRGFHNQQILDRLSQGLQDPEALDLAYADRVIREVYGG